MAKKKTTGRKLASHQIMRARKQRRGTAKTATPRKVAASEVRRIDACLKRLRQAYRVATARSEDLLAVANSLGEVAVQKYTNSLIRDLCEKQFLRDLLALRDAIAEVPTGSLSPRLEALRLLPDALIQWLEERFGLAPFGRVGEELEMPASNLTNYDCEFAPPHDPKALVQVEVIEAGWKRGNTPLVRPRVKMSQSLVRAS